MPNKDRLKRNETQRKWNHKNRDRCVAAVKRCRQKHGPIYELNEKEARRLKREKWMVIIHGLGMDHCFKCGYNKCFSAIEFHHSDGAKKTNEPGQIILRCPTPERIEEIKGCIALCANCHREYHAP